MQILQGLQTKFWLGGADAYAAHQKGLGMLYEIVQRNLKNLPQITQISLNILSHHPAFLHLDPCKLWDFRLFGAGNGIRTRDFNLGKVALYH